MSELPSEQLLYTTVTPVEAFAAEDGTIYPTRMQAESRNQFLFEIRVGELFMANAPRSVLITGSPGNVQIGRELQRFLDAVYPLLNGRNKK